MKNRTRKHILYGSMERRTRKYGQPSRYDAHHNLVASVDEFVHKGKKPSPAKKIQNEAKWRKILAA